MEVETRSSILDEETSWKFVDVNSVSAVSIGITSIGLVGRIFDAGDAISMSVVANMGAVLFLGNTESTGATAELSTDSGGNVDAVPT